VGERRKKKSLLPWREKVRMRGGIFLFNTSSHLFDRKSDKCKNSSDPQNNKFNPTYGWKVPLRL